VFGGVFGWTARARVARRHAPGSGKRMRLALDVGAAGIYNAARPGFGVVHCFRLPVLFFGTFELSGQLSRACLFRRPRTGSPDNRASNCRAAHAIAGSAAFLSSRTVEAAASMTSLTELELTTRAIDAKVSLQAKVEPETVA
jgi:hypothetical protein